MCHHQHHILVAIALMAASIILQGVFFVEAATTTTTTSSKLPVYAATTAYDVLEQNSFPRGLLPLGVQSYELDAGGAFQVTFPGECNFFVTVTAKHIVKFRFESSVNGTIKPGSISGLSGVRVHVESALLEFSQVTRQGNLLNFLVQNSTRSLPASAFTESAPCSSFQLAA